MSFWDVFLTRLFYTAKHITVILKSHMQKYDNSHLHFDSVFLVSLINAHETK